MSNGNLVPASALSRYYQTYQNSVLVIGSSSYTPPSQASQDVPYYWLVVVDLTDLSVVVNGFTDSTSVPTDVAQYADNSRYFLFCIGNALSDSDFPQGDLYTFLQNVGSGPKLASLEQMIEQFGSGTLLNFSYILAASMTENDLPGFEQLALTHYAAMAMQFMPVTVNGQTLYAPVLSS